MKRLITRQGKNSPDEYDRIFLERQEKGVNWADVRRWKKLLKYYKGGSIVDIGCLDSLVLPIARKKYVYDSMVGVDVAKQAMMEMQTKYPSIIYSVDSLYNFPKEWDELFDYAVMGEVIEHLEEPEKAIKEAFRILKTGGTLALSTPKGESHLGEVDGERHVWSYDILDILALLCPYGKTTIEVLRSQKFPWYKYCFPQITAFCQKE